MNKKIAIIGSCFVLIGIVLGAFGAHALKEVIEPEQLISYETGVRYLIYHGLGLLMLGLSDDKVNLGKWAGRLMVLGVVLFSGSIFLLSLQAPIGLNLKFLGPVTPIGGLLLIISWGLVVKALINVGKKSS